MGALYKGFIATAIFSLIILYFVTDKVIGLDNYFSTTNSVTSWVLTVFSISSAIGIISLGFIIFIVSGILSFLLKSIK